MVALKINRINLLELGQVTVMCQKCGFGVIVDVKKGRLVITQCPSCKLNFGDSAETMFHNFVNSYLEAERGKRAFPGRV